MTRRTVRCPAERLPPCSPGEAVRRVSVSEPVFLGREVEYVADCMSRRRLSMGEYTERFEDAFADFVGVKHAIACSSGSTALHLALLGVGVGPGHAVLVPALTYVATANAVVHTGATPVFVDVDRETWCMSPSGLSEAWGAYCVAHRPTLPRVVLPVHLYGQLADVRALQGGTGAPWVVVEDAAQAHGAADAYSRRAGALGDVGTFSFYASKLIACGEGGMVTTDRDDVAERVRLLRGQGTPRPGVYEHTEIGFNYRITELASAVGLAQLETYQEHADRRSAIMARYLEQLGGAGTSLQARDRGAADWMLACLLPEDLIDRGFTAAGVIRLLAKVGVETRPFFVPLNTLPPYADLGYGCPVAETVYPRGINLPTHAAMADADVDYVVAKLKEALSDVRREADG